MDFRKVLSGRRSVRAFTKSEISPGLLQQLIDLATLAPSAHNQQPWEFWVVADPRRLASMSTQVKTWLVQQLNERVQGGLARELIAPTFSVLHNAPALVLVVARSTSLQDDEDCCLAALSLLYAAYDCGLASCWVGLARAWFNLASTKAELKIPDGYTVVAPVVLGYPAAWPDTPGRNPARVHWLSPVETTDASDSLIAQG